MVAFRSSFCAGAGSATTTPVAHALHFNWDCNCAYSDMEAKYCHPLPLVAVDASPGIRKIKRPKKRSVQFREEWHPSVIFATVRACAWWNIYVFPFCFIYCPLKSIAQNRIRGCNITQSGTYTSNIQVYTSISPCQRQRCAECATCAELFELSPRRPKIHTRTHNQEIRPQRQTKVLQ